MEKSYTPEEVVTHALEGAIDRQVVLSPLVWQPGKRGSKVWYFTISTSGADGWRSDMILTGADQESGEFDRRRIVEFIERRPFVIHNCDDELYAARLCETLWPGKRITAVREEIEAERHA